MRQGSIAISESVVTGEQAAWLDLDRAIDKPAAVRVHVGEFFEEASRVLFGATRHQIDSTAEVCPDLSVGRHRYIECKSIGNSRQGILYAHRLKKDRRLLRATGGVLSYVFWIHNVEATACRSLHELRSKLATSCQLVICVPFERLWRACRRLAPCMGVYRASEGGRAELYRLPWRLLLSLAGDARRQAWNPPAITVHGHRLDGLTVRGADIGRCLPRLSAEEQRTAGWMAEQLRHEHLDVVLAPAPRQRHGGHAVRVVQARNPEWYRDLCATRTSKRKRARVRLHDTAIERRHVLPALDRLARGAPRFGYDFLCLPYVRHLARGEA